MKNPEIRAYAVIREAFGKRARGRRVAVRKINRNAAYDLYMHKGTDGTEQFIVKMAVAHTDADGKMLGATQRSTLYGQSQEEAEQYINYLLETYA